MPRDSAAPAPSARISFLDALRVFAFASVLIGHKFYPYLAAVANDPTVHITLRTLARAVIPLCEAGGAGVVVFFLVSGYIITHVILRESGPAFLIKRAFRIYPLYVFAVVCEIVVNHFVTGELVPPWQVLLPRLTLTGDFFGTPYALLGVEWTLRIEILFYAVMAWFRAVSLTAQPRWLPLAFFGVVIALQALGPFSTHPNVLRGYVTLYMPFLFFGACIYLAERRLAKLSACVALSAYVLLSYLVLLPSINPALTNSNFAAYACGIFFVVWSLRHSIATSRWLTVFSELTYAVYLFHNWLWVHLTGFVVRIHADMGHPQLSTLALLLVICALSYQLVERPGIRLGAALARRLAPGA